ncbi:protein BCAP isoform X2 [Rhinatrema bivittatum]|uniref:protein BCAP isoform X2 n=1 Tax=Rhinatrema bivittatum TaxID=194408 RepID=UPI0011278A64|nr:protein BCAP isoform X2 [Rhinatrema bivittatum]
MKNRSSALSFEHAYNILSLTTQAEPRTLPSLKSGDLKSVEMNTGKLKSGKARQSSHSEKTHQREGASDGLSVSPGEVEKICSVIQFTDSIFSKDDAFGKAKDYKGPSASHLKENNRSKNRFLAHLDEEPFAQTQDIQTTLSKILDKQETMLEELSSQLSRVVHQPPLQQSSNENAMKWLKRETPDGRTMLLAKLHEVEMAARSTEILLSLLKDSVAEMPSAANLSASDVMNITNQNDQLLRELESFKNLKRTLEHLLKRNEHKKFSSKEIKNDIDDLLERVLEIETEDVDKAVKTKELSLSIEAMQDRLQSLIEKKEAENSRITAQIQDLERIMTKRKMEIEDLKHENLAVKEKSALEREALKKATRAQKQRKQRFETAAENLAPQIRAQEVNICEALSACNVWKSHHEGAAKEKSELEIEFKALTKQITDILADLQKIQDDERSSKEQILGKIHAAETENANIVHENETLKASIADLEKKSVSVEDELLDLQCKTKHQKSFFEQYEAQVFKIQAETIELGNRLEKVLRENKLITKKKDLETETVEAQMEAYLTELEHVGGLLRTAEQRLQECQKNLLIGKRKYAVQSKTIRKLQAKVDANNLFLDNQSCQEENNRIQKKLVELNQKFEKTVMLNQELENQVANQEKNLHDSGVQLEEKSRECTDLIRLLEAAVKEGKKQVSEEKKKISTNEQDFQKKIMDLEIELSMRKEEQKQLACMLSSSEKHYELHMKELHHSLEQTENKNQGIQNYVEFLKTTYATMFG